MDCDQGVFELFAPAYSLLFGGPSNNRSVLVFDKQQLPAAPGVVILQLAALTSAAPAKEFQIIATPSSRATVGNGEWADNFDTLVYAGWYSIPVGGGDTAILQYDVTNAVTALMDREERYIHLKLTAPHSYLGGGSRYYGNFRPSNDPVVGNRPRLIYGGDVNSAATSLGSTKALFR